ncbi:hypothetical protein C0081_15835 [Cohaesibacter celericrescens]|uniref:Uncharacterized protein n=1 Tax=Cohaesibacter celericrescens TaxID=2067669 RepID=A0A2N5XPD0_9HYPH|nr:hypothetical protein C0081_15835 [Cohaesibacter celericrescens]
MKSDFHSAIYTAPSDDAMFETTPVRISQPCASHTQTTTDNPAFTDLKAFVIAKRDRSICAKLRGNPMSQIQSLYLWTSTFKPQKGRKNAFADPLESPEWRPFLKWIELYHRT